MKTILLLLALVSPAVAQGPPSPKVHNTFSDAELNKAKEIMQNITEKMPVWDADWPGQFERKEIEVVRIDLLMCNEAEDAYEFMDDFKLLISDFQALVALDDALHIEHVI